MGLAPETARKRVRPVAVLQDAPALYTPMASQKKDAAAASAAKAAVAVDEATPVVGRRLRARERAAQDENATERSSIAKKGGASVRRSMRLSQQQAPPQPSDTFSSSAIVDESGPGVRRSMRISRQQLEDDVSPPRLRLRSRESSANTRRSSASAEPGVRRSVRAQSSSEEGESDSVDSPTLPARAVESKRRRQAVDDGFVAPAPVVEKDGSKVLAGSDARRTSARLTRSKRSNSLLDMDVELQQREQVKSEEREKEKQKALAKEKREEAKRLKEAEAEKLRLKQEAEEKQRMKEEAEEREREKQAAKKKQQEEEAKRKQKEQAKKQKEEEEEAKRLQKELAKKQKEKEEKKRAAAVAAASKAKLSKKPVSKTVAEPMPSVKSPHRPTGKRVALLASKFEQQSEHPAPAVVQAAAPVAVGLLQLSEEEGAALSARLDAIAASALTSVPAATVRLRKRKTAGERAEAWSSRRDVTHSSLRDLLASHGIVRPDAGDKTVDAAMNAIPEVRAEIGDEIESSKKARPAAVEVVSVAAPVVVAPVAVAATQPPAPNFSAFKPAPYLYEDSGVSDSGVSDSEDEAPTVKKTIDAGPKSLSTIQDTIAELKRRVNETAPVRVATPPPVIFAPSGAFFNPLASRMAEGAPEFDVSLHLASPSASAGTQSPVTSQSMHVIDESELCNSQCDFAPGLFTVELKGPAVQRPAGPPGRGSPPEKQFVGAMMDGSFNGVSDSEAYNSGDMEKAQNAVQFLEQIQLNGTNMSILHNVTLGPIIEDEKDEDDDEDDEEGESDFSPMRDVDPMQVTAKTFDLRALAPVQQVHSAIVTPTTLLPKPLRQQQQPEEEQPAPMAESMSSKQLSNKRGLDQSAQQQQHSEVQREAHGVKRLAVAVESKPTAAERLDRHALAKQRREQIEEEERRKREEAVKIATEREQRAKAKKVAPVEVKPLAKGVEAKPSKAAILEKSKRNVETLVKAKVDAKTDASRKKPATASAAPVVVQLPPAPVALQGAPAAGPEKKGLFSAFGKLKPGSKKMAASENGVNGTKPSALPVPLMATVSPVKSPGAMRASPLRKNAAPSAAVSPRARTPPPQQGDANVTRWSISPHKESDAEEDAPAQRPRKNPSKWTRSDVLLEAIRGQSLDTADCVFGAPIGLTCDLHAIFPNFTRNKAATRPRSSSAQWSDAPAKTPFGVSSVVKK